MDIIQVITQELKVEKWQVEAAVKLIDEGNTIPFISRYRKEATGSLNDEQLRTLYERLSYLRNLEDKKNQVLKSIEDQGKLTEELKKLNPLKIKDELISKHGFYEYKIKELLLALATGMRPAKLYNGTDSAICGFLFVTGEGEVLCYQRAFRQTFADFLFQNSRLEKGSTEKDKYGYLERENGVYYFKLNLKIGLLKR